MEFDPTWDAQRQRLYRLVTDKGDKFRNVSLQIGKNAAYLQQYLQRGTPAALGEEERVKLGRYFSVSPDEFRRPGPDQKEAQRLDHPLLRQAIIATLVALTENGRSLDDIPVQDIAGAILRTYDLIAGHIANGNR